MRNTYAVILAGGRGERFWPLSTKEHPKQLLPIGSDRPMIEESVKRITPLVPPEKILIITNENLKSKIEKLVPEIPAKNIIGEPIGRNTAPAIGLGSVLVRSGGEEAVVIVLTADHIIKDGEKFLKVLKKAVDTACEHESIVTIGIAPGYPETGYGHIKPAGTTNSGEDIEVFEVEKFVEKPDIGKAVEYTENGYLWNAGIFVFKASDMLGAISEHMPSLYKGLMKIKDALGSNRQEKVIKEVYEGIESESIDYGVIEKLKDVYVIKGDFAWNDVGSWSAFDDIYPKDGNGNVKKGRTVEVDTKNSILVGGKRLIAAVGVEDLIVVETDDAVLVCRKDKAQKVKDLARKIEKKSF